MTSWKDTRIFCRHFEAGEPDAVVAVAAVGSPEERADAKEAYAFGG
jgi:hypothetical protein